jgi:hypothetical protein
MSAWTSEGSVSNPSLPAKCATRSAADGGGETGGDRGIDRGVTVGVDGDVDVIPRRYGIVDPERWGFSILAYLRLRYSGSSYEPLHELLRETPEVVEAHHVTGDDCVIMEFVETSAAADTTELSFGRWHYNKG